MSSPTETAALDRLQESLIDGRTDNLRYRQSQLHALHSALCTAAPDLVAAACSPSWTPAEAEAEYYLAMNSLRHAYTTISDFSSALQREYSVVHGRDFPERRVGVGMVVVRPGSHARLFSIVCVLAAALAAGNCVVLELSETAATTRHAAVDALLRKVLGAALDPNTFAIVKSAPAADLLPDPNALLLVDQTGAASAGLVSDATARCVAIVDRTADLDAAARAIVAARFGFGGRSPYAPDLVLVHEFAKTEFFEACSRYASLAFAAGKGTAQEAEADSTTRKAVEEAEARGEVVGFGSAAFKLVDVQDKESKIAKMKISGRYLPISTYSSLTDAVYNQEFETPLLAGYFFATPKAAKFLAQFVPARLALVNQIPTHLLLGPAAPTSQHAPDFLYRYSPAMFSVARPQYAEPVPAPFQKVDEALLSLLPGDGAKASSSSKTDMLRKAAVQPLPPTGQPSNKGVGFFESGILTGFGMYLTMVLPVVGYTTYLLGRKGFEYASRFRS